MGKDDESEDKMMRGEEVERMEGGRRMRGLKSEKGGKRRLGKIFLFQEQRRGMKNECNGNNCPALPLSLEPKTFDISLMLIFSQKTDIFDEEV